MATSVILLAVPIVGIFTGAVVLGETISLGDLIGFAVTLTGIVTLSLLASNGQGRHPPKAPAEPVPGNSPASTTP
jgi:drug/metabolite transporter (DMT)-like permease